jgi:Holliday junction resolvase-like predicted endonuclease
MLVVDEILKKLCWEGFCQQRRGVVKATPIQRLKVAVRAIDLGADFERVSSLLQWREFETLAAEVFRANDYDVISNFRFKQAGKRWEIDLLACRKPTVLSVDCKHWHHGWSRKAVKKAVEMQINRTRALKNAFPLIHERIKVGKWKHVKFVPMLLSLTKGPFKFHSNVPIVSILQLQNFLNELPAYVPLLTHFSIKIKFEKHKLTKYLQQ